MNTLYGLSIVFLGTIFLHFVPVGSIECYQCQSEVDLDCLNNPKQQKFLKPCSDLPQGPKYIACRRIENAVDFEVLKQSPTKRVTRQCAAETKVKKGNNCYTRSGFGGKSTVCECFENGCNSASIPVVSFAAMIFTFVVFFRNVS